MKKAQLIGNTQKGSGILEILIAFSILTLSITAAIVIAFGNQSIVIDTETNQEALYKAERDLQEIKKLASVDFNAVITSATINEDIYTIWHDVLDITPCLKVATSTVTWNVSPIRNQIINLTTRLIDLPGVAALGGDCDTEAVGDWDNPETYGDINLTPAGVKGTGVDVIKRDGDRLVFLTSDISSIDKSDFWIIRANDPAVPGDPITPVILSDLDVGYSLFDVDAHGDYAYVAHASTTDQLKVINVSDTSAPLVVASETLPGVGNSFPEGRTIYFYDEKVYIGTRETAGDEFHIYDVSTPKNPVHLGSEQINHNVEDIVVIEQEVAGLNKIVAYIATSATSASAPELTILDVTVPGSIVGLNSFNPTGIRYGTSVYILGNKLYLGTARDGSEPNFFILDISDPLSITELGSLDLSLNPGREVVGITIRGVLAFIITTDPNNEFQVFNVSDPANIVPASACSYNYPEKPTDFDFVDNLGFVANESNTALRIIRDDPSVCTL